MKKNINKIDLTQEEIKRYSKQILIKNIGGSGQVKLKSAKILIVGLGGLGAPVITHLVTAGIGEVGLVDHDTVELSNLQRQYIHTTERVGLLKTHSAKEYITQLNPNIKISLYSIKASIDNISEIIPNYDLVIDCTDNFETRFIIADQCQVNLKPYILGMVRGYEGQLTTILPRLSKNRESYPGIRSLYDESDLDDYEFSCSDEGVLSVTTGLIGTIMATEAIKNILDIGEILVGKLLLVDLLNIKFELIEYT